ncbi:MAG TPA: hypothetical protein VKU19_03060 [Bryobacteraceae bacterium]|nr:hypothetical protein [Bryobacteraceae bacterium]
MRGVFVTAAILWGATVWGQNGRDCALAATARDRAICASPRLKALDEEFESKLEQTLESSVLLDPESLARQRQRWDLDVARCGKPDDEACLRGAYERRFTFLQNLRISAALEPGPSDAARLRTLHAGDLLNESLFELLTMHPELAPIAASQIGPDWIYWAEVGAGPGASLRALPGGRWLTARGSIATKDSQRDLYVAIDLRDGQLSMVYYHDYSGEAYEPFHELHWVTTARSWPDEAARVLAPLGGKAWQPENVRRVGLPSTRLRPLARKSDEIREGLRQVSLLWEDLSVLGLIGDPEYDQLRRAWDEENDECGKANSVDTCLSQRLEERRVFVRSERLAQGLDRLPADARLELAELSGSGLDRLSTRDLLTVQPVVAPLAASVIGPDWLSWTESAVESLSDGVESVAGGRWLIARGVMIHNVVRSEIWVAIDRVNCQLWIVRLEEYHQSASGPEVRWASTAAGWPAEVGKLFTESVPDWDTAMVRQVGLAETRTRPRYASRVRK